MIQTFYGNVEIIGKEINPYLRTNLHLLKAIAWYLSYFSVDQSTIEPHMDVHLPQARARHFLKVFYSAHILMVDCDPNLQEKF